MRRDCEVRVCEWVTKKLLSSLAVDGSAQSEPPCLDAEIDGCLPVASSTLYDLVCVFIIEKLAWLCCLGICPFIMRLQNRKTNSGNRPPNVINFAGTGKGKNGGWGGIIAGGRILISCRFLPVWLAWPWPITSELCVTVSLPALPKRRDTDRRCRACSDRGERRDGKRRKKDETRCNLMGLQKSKQNRKQGRKKTKQKKTK